MFTLTKKYGNRKTIKNIGLALMVLGLGFMVIRYIQSENINYVLGGLVVVSIGSLMNYFGNKKQMRSNQNNL